MSKTADLHNYELELWVIIKEFPNRSVLHTGTKKHSHGLAKLSRVGGLRRK